MSIAAFEAIKQSNPVKIIVATDTSKLNELRIPGRRADTQSRLASRGHSPWSYEGDSSPAYGAAQPEHATKIATLIESFLSRYQVVNSESLYWGVPGSSWFFTSSFIPAAAHRVPGLRSELWRFWIFIWLGMGAVY